MKKGLRKYPVTVIVRSCLTGAPVWVYQGASKNGARQAYWRACKAEIEFVSRLPEYCAQWKAGLERFISSCMEKYPIDAKLTPEQAAAAKKLRAMLKKGPDINLDFYNHVMEERRRRAEDHEIRRQMREREAQERLEKQKRRIASDN